MGSVQKVEFFLVQRLNERRWLSILEIYNPAWSPGHYLRPVGSAPTTSFCARKRLRLRNYGTAIDEKAYAVLHRAFVSILLSNRNFVNRRHVAQGLRRWAHTSAY